MPPPLGLFAGAISGFEVTDSMAKEIEDALAALIGPLPTAPAKMVADRRKLFIAISRGVIQHLKNHERDFQIIDEDTIDPHSIKNEIFLRP
jgi:hypothetical protein